MYSLNSIDAFCHQAIERGDSWEEIQALCQRRSTMLCQWSPETMDDVRLRARTHRHSTAMRRWYRNAPVAGEHSNFDMVDALAEWTSND